VSLDASVGVGVGCFIGTHKPALVLYTFVIPSQHDALLQFNPAVVASKLPELISLCN